VGARREGEDLARWLARSAPLSLALASVALGFPFLWAWPPRLCLPFISVSGGGDRRGDGTMPPLFCFPVFLGTGWWSALCTMPVPVNLTDHTICILKY
jgi:hypothetical protein